MNRSKCRTWSRRLVLQSSRKVGQDIMAVPVSYHHHHHTHVGVQESLYQLADKKGFGFRILFKSSYICINHKYNGQALNRHGSRLLARTEPHIVESHQFLQNKNKQFFIQKIHSLKLTNLTLGSLPHFNERKLRLYAWKSSVIKRNFCCRGKDYC